MEMDSIVINHQIDGVKSPEWQVEAAECLVTTREEIPKNKSQRESRNLDSASSSLMRRYVERIQSLGLQIHPRSYPAYGLKHFGPLAAGSL